MIKKINFGIFLIFEIILFGFVFLMGRTNNNFNDFIPFLILLSFMFIVGKTRYEINIINDKIYLSNFFWIKIRDIKDFEIVFIHKSSQGAFCIKTKKELLRMKNSDDNYKIIYLLVKDNKELENQLENNKKRVNL